MKRSPTVAVVVVLAISGLACGGGGETTARSNPAAPDAAPEPALGPLEEKAGAAHAFVHAGMDNSIPTYGTEAPSAEVRKAEAELRAYLAARAAGNWRRACAGLSAGTREGLGRLGRRRRDCQSVYGALTGSIPPSVRASQMRGHLVSLRVHGSNGFALFYGPGRQQYVMPMRQEGGTWKMTQIAAIEYPPGSGGVRP